jgi:uncharacterized membrane protein HdeD (DUF308 family)
MTKGAKFWNIIVGAIALVMGAALFVYPKQGIVAIAVLASLSFTLKGLNTMLYYFTMAKNMVGGKRTLYRGMLFIDVGILTSAMVTGAATYIAMYLAGMHAFSGLVDILRSREAKKAGARDWYWTAINGAVNLIVAICVMIGGVMLDSTEMVVYIYATGVISYGVQRIAAAFRKTAIVYIQ